MKSIQQWFDEYGVSHQNPTNKLIHWICVPLIFFSIIGLLASIPAASLRSFFTPGLQPYIHWGTAVLLLALLFYLRLSFPMFLGIALFSALCLYGVKLLARVDFPLWAISLIIFAASWVGQFIGHKIEGQKPSFFKDIQFLMIGPAWLMGFIYRKLGIAY